MKNIDIIEFNNLDKLNNIQLNNKLFVFSKKLINKLLVYENIPVKNRRIFIKNILEFFQYLDIKFNLNEENLIEIPQSVFIKFFSERRYIKYLKILKDLELMTNVPHADGTWWSYEKKIVKLFRIHDNYYSGDSVIIITTKPRSNYKSEFILDDKLTNLNEKFINTIKKVNINVRNAVEDEIKNYLQNKTSINSLRSRLNRILNLKNNRYIVKGNKVERIYHSFSNLSKISRKHLTRNFNYIDITNSQPLLLVAYLKKNNMDVDDNYQRDVENGKFYEKFFNVKNQTRSEIKPQIYKNLLFGFDVRSLYNKRFKEIYPNTWESLRIIKEEKASLAQRLQNTEAELFNNIIPQKSKYYFTLFDAVYFSDFNDFQQIEKEIREFFSKLNIKVKIEIG